MLTLVHWDIFPAFFSKQKLQYGCFMGILATLCRSYRRATNIDLWRVFFWNTFFVHSRYASEIWQGANLFWCPLTTRYYKRQCGRCVRLVPYFIMHQDFRVITLYPITMVVLNLLYINIFKENSTVTKQTAGESFRGAFNLINKTSNQWRQHKCLQFSSRGLSKRPCSSRCHYRLEPPQNKQCRKQLTNQAPSVARLFNLLMALLLISWCPAGEVNL